MKVENTQENLSKCVCEKCPSYNECMQGESQSLFCGREESGCDFEQQGCLCSDCPITAEFELSERYFCGIR